MAAIHVFSRQMAPGDSYPSTGPTKKHGNKWNSLEVLLKENPPEIYISLKAALRILRKGDYDWIFGIVVDAAIVLAIGMKSKGREKQETRKKNREGLVGYEPSIRT